ncbi:hypothetical protein EIKCOROL_02441 [Eikenella corrodens ATCC 23834]|uniref:Uncharacterized protein n=1 Tax=Eikenella corrodens ATCC 23834 TaxID=546274 RepID=C0DYH7_EIKCO|nr:hypothetical protein EIKCOROL_02441 [Eikenella corrodens ATCC 23834]
MAQERLPESFQVAFLLQPAGMKQAAAQLAAKGRIIVCHCELGVRPQLCQRLPENWAVPPQSVLAQQRGFAIFPTG